MKADVHDANGADFGYLPTVELTKFDVESIPDRVANA